jgi:hypothetical protein
MKKLFFHGDVTLEKGAEEASDTPSLEPTYLIETVNRRHQA